jgi:rhodanese-related sulfurtransferase
VGSIYSYTPAFRIQKKSGQRSIFKDNELYGQMTLLIEQKLLLETFMAHDHSPRFLRIAEDARSRVTEISLDDVKAKLDRGEDFLLVDVREESEYAADHLPGAIHLGKGIIERDIESRVPNTATPLVLYCGGGFRSALAADNLQKMGYTSVLSMKEGIRGWRERAFPLTAK